MYNRNEKSACITFEYSSSPMSSMYANIFLTNNELLMLIDYLSINTNLRDFLEQKDKRNVSSICSVYDIILKSDQRSDLTKMIRKHIVDKKYRFKSYY